MFHLPRELAEKGMRKPVSMDREVIRANQLESAFLKTLHV